jgi:hypothetical protein
MDTSYETTIGHPHDFKVRYSLIGSRPVYQGVRFDFMFDNDDFPKDSLHVIWPEFEDKQGEVELNKDKPVTSKGTARMWIVVDELRERYKKNIKIGTRGYFMAGPNKTGECEVFETNW